MSIDKKLATRWTHTSTAVMAHGEAVCHTFGSPAIAEYICDLHNKQFPLLDACPHCGNETAPRLMTGREADYANTSDRCVVCDMTKGGCGASSRFSNVPSEAINNWNRRA